MVLRLYGNLDGFSVGKNYRKFRRTLFEVDIEYIPGGGYGGSGGTCSGGQSAAQGKKSGKCFLDYAAQAMLAVYTDKLVGCLGAADGKDAYTQLPGSFPPFRRIRPISRFL